MIARLDPAQAHILLRMAQAMALPVESNIDSESDILTPGVAIAFSNKLLIHHATHDDRMNKKAFEYALKYAAEADEKSVVLNPDPTNPAEDLRIDGVRFSLKTQADNGIKRNSVYIQKLMEARWIRECSTPDDFAREATRRIAAHLGQYERILVLRAFDEGSHIRYEIVEIPLAVLMLIGSLTPADFSPRNRFGSSGADVRDNDGVAFRVLLDGSVEKVRVFNLRRSRCRFHGEWLIPKGEAAAGSPE